MYQRWLVPGLIGGTASLSGSAALAIFGRLNQPPGCGTSPTFFPDVQILLAALLLLSGAAGWLTMRAGGSPREAAMAGLVVGAMAGVVPFFAVSSTLPTVAPGCPPIPDFVSQNYASIVMQTRVTALGKLAGLGLLGGLLSAGSKRQRRGRTGSPSAAT